MSKTIKILVAYHKRDILIKDEVFTPIHVGRKGWMNKNPNSEDKQWFVDNMIGDDTGDNISEKNPRFNEMTALYWAWKNYNSLGNPDYIGLLHYRRHFVFKGGNTPYMETNKYDPTYLERILGYNVNQLLKTLSKVDLIGPLPYNVKSVYSHYSNAQNHEELDEVVRILKEKNPEFNSACDKYLMGNKAYFCNMFIMPKSLFFRYCEFIFPILFEYEKNTRFTSRMYVSERLTGIFTQKLLDEGKKYLGLPTMYLAETTPIDIVMATDSNYLHPTAVSIVSIMENSKPSSLYNFYILTSKSSYSVVSDTLIELSKRYSNFKIEIIAFEMDTDVEIKIKHTAVPTFYRLFLPTLLPNVNKCLYIDGDTAVISDLAELYRLDISENLIAGVKAPGYYYPPLWEEKHSGEIGIPINQYVNAGVLLMNLKRMRDEGIDKKMQQLIPRGYSSQDQDIINIVCHGKIRIIDPIWNMMTKYLTDKDGVVTMLPEAAAVLEKNVTDVRPKIIHYADKIKPWSGKCPFDDIWHKYESILQRSNLEPKVSVIIPAFNVDKYVGQCLDTVLSQTLRDIEVICINDGSTDFTLDILEEYAKRDNRIVLLDQNNKGVGVTRNIGIEYSMGKYIAFMDPDDYYPSPDVLEKMYNAAISNNVLIVGGSWSEDIDGTVKTKFYGKYEKYVFDRDEIVKYSDYQFDYGFTRFIYNRNLIKGNNILFPPYSRFQDPPFFQKAMVTAEQFYSLKIPTYRYRWGHKQINWTDKKVADLIRGLTDTLIISKENQLAELHKSNVTRLNEEYAPIIVNKIKSPGSDINIFSLLIKANSMVDCELLGIPRSEGFTLKPICELLEYYSELKKQSSPSTVDCSHESVLYDPISNNEILNWGLNTGICGGTPYKSKYIHKIFLPGRMYEAVVVNRLRRGTLLTGIFTDDKELVLSGVTVIGENTNQISLIINVDNDTIELKSFDNHNVNNSVEYTLLSIREKGSYETISLLQTEIVNAQNGDVGAAKRLSDRYCYGKGVVVNQKESFRWCRVAARNGDIDSMIKVGLAYRRGKEVGVDLSKSITWFKKAASLGSIIARRELFEVFWEEKGHDEEMIATIKDLVESGDGISLGLLAKSYRFGRGVPIDLDKAAELLRLSSSKGIGWAVYDLFETLWAINTPKSNSEAVEVINKKVIEGDGQAIGLLAKCYRFGRGVEQDYATAIELLALSSRKGVTWARNDLEDALSVASVSKDYVDQISITSYNPDIVNGGADIRLARAYREGRGVDKNLIESSKWYRVAINKGYSNVSKELLGVLWSINTPSSLAEFTKIVLDQTDLTDPELIGRLGQAYRSGVGVKKNLPKAKECMEQSIVGGVTWARTELLNILWEMDTEESNKELFTLSRTLADEGNPQGMGWLGKAYLYGRGTKKDKKQAEYWLTQSFNYGITWVEPEIKKINEKKGNRLNIARKKS